MKKFIFTRKEDDVIFEMSDDCQVQEKTGYPLIHNGTLAIGCPCNQYEVETPDNIVTEKFKYTEAEGFTKNENYKRYYSLEEQVQALQEVVNEIILGGNE